MLALLSMSLWAPGASRCRDYPMRWISQQEMCEILGKDTVSVQNWVLVRFADMVDAINTETYWNILKLSNRLVKVSTFRIYCTTSLGPKTLQRKSQHGASSEGQKMYCHEVGISSSRGHVFGHECWMCQGKPLHTTLWRPMIGGKSQEDAHQ